MHVTTLPAQVMLNTARLTHAALPVVGCPAGAFRHAEPVLVACHLRLEAQVSRTRLLFEPAAACT